MYETVPSYVKPSGSIVTPYPVEGTLPGIPKQPTATERTASSKLEALLTAHGIKLAIRDRGEGDTTTDFGRDEAGGYVFHVGPDSDLAEALEFAHTVIRRHHILPESLDPEYLADRKLTRLVPAKVGPSGRAQVVYIECPEWCVVDHSDREGCLEDVMHYSDADVLQVLTLTDDDTAHSEIYATIASDPAASDRRLRAAHIVINDGASTDAYVTPDMAEELADDLVAFAARLRHKARTVRLFNRAGGAA
ncbi:hypothetical protein OG883_34425 [Streptomyces sp. NBC_01142]|uniref:DUF6907 domain-containing protein n=1 Tax=Streptomyces sp. NBC_01142 TaxID=2975865 RepID=UPI0022523D78|nr:hypothetical protein [Streptomyces sp. NBC_01142]MCX4824863.1 hypothetical protein [Streptomyces sp. NBC_01142]